MASLPEADQDAEIMAKVRAGDNDSFALLVRRHGDSVNRFIRRMVRDPAQADELAQEVFLRVYRAREKYQPTAKFTTWLFRIATRIALNGLRDRRPAEELSPAIADNQPSVEDALQRENKAAEVRKAVQALPSTQRAAVLMHKYEEMDYKEIAKVLDCSEAALKSILFRAYETLRKRLVHLNGKEDRKNALPIGR